MIIKHLGFFTTILLYFNLFAYSQKYEVIKVDKNYKGESLNSMYVKLKITYTIKENFILSTYKNEVIKIGNERVYPFDLYAPLKIMAYTNKGLELEYGYNFMAVRRPIKSHKIKVRIGESLSFYTNIFLIGFNVPNNDAIKYISIKFNTYEYIIDSDFLKN